MRDTRYLFCFAAIFIGAPSCGPGLAEQQRKPSTPPTSALLSQPMAHDEIMGLVRKRVELALSCDKTTNICKLAKDMSNTSPFAAGLTLYTTGASAHELSSKAASGLLTQSEVRAFLNQKTIGVLPAAVEDSAASSSLKLLRSPALAKTGRAAAVAGAVLLSYSAYEYFFGSTDAPPDTHPTPQPKP